MLSTLLASAAARDDVPGTITKSRVMRPLPIGRPTSTTHPGTSSTIPSHPIALFREWQRAAGESGSLSFPAAACLSTVDAEGCAEARFVDIKAVSEAGFVFCTHLESPKAAAIAANPQVALTFWWDHIGRQVRVAGRAERISDAEADVIFRERARDAQLIAWASRQSSPLEDPHELASRLAAVEGRFRDEPVPRPAQWGGYCVVPSRIEFLTFRADRCHERLRFEWHEHGWRRYLLEP